jgi:hypothetical protein
MEDIDEKNQENVTLSKENNDPPITDSKEMKIYNCLKRNSK